MALVYVSTDAVDLRKMKMNVERLSSATTNLIITVKGIKTFLEVFILDTNETST